MDPLVVLVRESVQNSWDARRRRGQVAVEIEGATLTDTQRDVLRNDVLGESPPRGLFDSAPGGGEELTDILDDAQLELLTITDRGTAGLGGPVRADQPAQPGELTDFVDLVFNVGQPPDKEMGGGTYGFGKTISYLVSRCRTVIIHTSTEHAGRVQQRLIVQALGHQFSHAGRNYTGRHWWGDRSEHGIEPAVGDRAADIAGRLGIPAFEADECGTTIAVIAPDFGGRSSQDAMRFIAEALAWNFWPKMTGQSGRAASMNFSVRHEGRTVPIPAPETTLPLQGFVQALQAVRDCETGLKKPEDFPTMHIFEVWCKKPQCMLGWLAMHAVPAIPQPAQGVKQQDEDGPVRSPQAFAGTAHHIALMRRAELVVRYLPGPALSSPALEWCGVFRAAEETDRAFAAAEPPTHDDWRPALVGDRKGRTYVNVALRELRNMADRAFTTPPTHRESSNTSASAAVVAEALGGIVAPAGGAGASQPSRQQSERQGTKRLRTPKVGVSRQWLDTHTDPDSLTLRVEFTVEPAVETDSTKIRAIASAASAEGVSTESEPPAEAAIPVVEGFRRNGTLLPGAEVDISADDRDPWIVEVRQPRGVATVVDLNPAIGTRS
jgi:hypothetical protein